MGRHQGRLELTWTNKDQALLSTGDGRYDYEFVDPHDPRVLEVRILHEVEEVEAAVPATRPPDMPDPTTGNLLITGDAMHALDALTKTPELAAEYLGKIKLVYIDPPFNTGQAFAHYEDNIEHSIWLTMLRDRLRQIRPLLAEDGSVWVHLDDVEVHRCRIVMDEMFGSECFVTEVIWQKADSPRMDAKQFSSSHDSILVYAKRPSWVPNRFAAASRVDYPFADADGRRYRAPYSLRKWGNNSAREDRPNGWYPITDPHGVEVWPIRSDGSDGRWRWGRQMVADNYDRLHWEDRGNGYGAYVKEYEDEERKTTPPVTLWPHSEVGHNRSAKAEVKALFPDSDPFSTPKPERLLQRILHIATNPGDIVLDCYAGSGTTAAVAHKMGRRWITSELLPVTAATFTLPRLMKVVRGEDPGGITTTCERAADGELPENLSPLEAQQLNTLLNRTVKHLSDADEAVDTGTIRAIRHATRTKDQVTQTWHGGGAFTHVSVGPSMYEVDEDGDVFLSPAATNGAWSKSVAAQLKFALTPDHPVFCGLRGRQRLAVIDGVADEVVVLTVLENLADRERAVIVAKAVLPEAQVLLSTQSPGSRIRKAPDDLFPKRTVK